MEVLSWSKGDWVFTTSHYNQGKSGGQGTTLLKIFFLCKWLFQCFSKISVISAHQTKTVYLLSFAIAFLDYVDISHRSIRHLIAWLDCSRMATRIDTTETGKASVKNGETEINIWYFFWEQIHGSSPSVLSCHLLLFPADVEISTWVQWLPGCT